jgi:hypothetical protein
VRASILVLAALGCGSSDSKQLAQCGPSGKCPTGFTCAATDNLCHQTGAASVDAAPALPDAPPPDAYVGCDPRSLTGAAATVGCADGTRDGLTDLVAFPAIAACAGSWSDDVANGAALCATGWHVCLGADAPVKIGFAAASSFCGCFAIDAAQDNYHCYSDCSASVGIADTAPQIDMGGMGAGCQWEIPSGDSCLASGRIDASENSGTGCNYYSGLSGVMCCRDVP